MAQPHEASAQHGTMLNRQPMRQEELAPSPITLDTLKQVGKTTSLVVFFARRQELAYQHVAHPQQHESVIRIDPMLSPRRTDQLHRFARILDTFTDLPFVQRFDLFANYVHGAITADAHMSGNFSANEAAQKVKEFLHIDHDVFTNALDIVSDPAINLRYKNALEQVSMSNRAREKGQTFIPTELHLLLYKIFSNEKAAYREWTEIGAYAQEKLGKAYPDLIYIGAAGLHYRLTQARDDLVAAGEADAVQLMHREQLAKKHNMDLLRQRMSIVTPEDGTPPYYFRDLPIPDITTQIGLSSEPYVAELLRDIARIDGMEIKHPDWREGPTEKMFELRTVIQDEVLPKLEAEGIHWRYGQVTYEQIRDAVRESPNCPDFVTPDYNMRAGARSAAIRDILPEIKPEAVDDAIFRDMENLIRIAPITDTTHRDVRTFLEARRAADEIFDRETVAFLCRRKALPVTNFIATTLGLDKGRDARNPAFAARITMRKVLRNKTGFEVEEETESMRRS